MHISFHSILGSQQQKAQSQLLKFGEAIVARVLMLNF